MNDFDLMPGALHRGLGIVARWSGSALIIPSDPAHDNAAEELIGALGPDPAPAAVAQLVRERVNDGTLRAVGMLLAATGGPMAMVFGPVEVVADGDIVLTGAGGLAERQVAGSERLTMRAAGLAKAAESVSPYDLRRGVAPGAGITVGQDVSAILASPPEAPVAPRRPDPPRHSRPVDPDPYDVDVPFRSEVLVSPNAPVEPAKPLAVLGGQRPEAGRVAAPEKPAPVAPPDRADLPFPDADTDQTDEVIVQGIVCSRGHFNNPQAQFCQACGINMVHVTHNLVPGPRPTLGFVVFDDGSTFGLNRSYLVGREPGDPADPHMAPLTIQDNNETLSRRHAEIRLVDWTVQLVDLGSTNGSFIWDTAMEHWNQIAPNQPVDLSPGDTVALGRRTFVFESVTRM
ncbi:MAG: FHA domain-containing protein [Actinomycetota bacterium]